MSTIFDHRKTGVSTGSIPRLCRWMCFAAACVAFGAGQNVSAAEAAHHGIVTYTVENHGEGTGDTLATFGAIFAPGDVPSGAALEATTQAGARVPLQVDAKARHPDGSLRHAVLTIDIAGLPSGARTVVTLSRANGPQIVAPPVPLSALPNDFDTVVALNMRGKTFSLSAKYLLARSQLKKVIWLSGPLVSEWWVAAPLRDKDGKADPHMYVQFGIRSYGANRPLRVEADVENDWSYIPDPRTEFYDAEIRAGSRVVFSKTAMSQPSQTRWRFGFWWREPVASYVRQNLEYLEKANVVPNYDRRIEVSQEALNDLLTQFDASEKGPLSAGIIEKYMPTTGGRHDIGPLPNWQAIYLLTMDPRAYRIALETADLGASFAAHYRNEKTRAPLNLEDYPNFSTHSNLVGRGPGQLPMPDSGGYKDSLVPDASHEPALDFVPYIITGDRFYLEELQFWSQWNLSGTAPVYRGYQAGLVKWDQVRGQAWSLRTLGQAEYITPDNDPMKNVLRRELRANVDWYNSTYARNPNSNGLHLIPENDAPYDNGLAMAPWQDDFFTWSVGYVQGLGDVDAGPILRWKSGFPVGRMVAPGFCWILASSYTMRVRPAVGAPIFQLFADVYNSTIAANFKKVANPQKLRCESPEMADALGLSHTGEMINEASSTDGYPAFMQPALAAAVDSGVPGASKAWTVFQSRSVKPNYSDDPTWAIVPKM